MKMEKEFIPYDESLALKELGFNEKCLAGFYTYVDENLVLDKYDYRGKFNINYSDEDDYIINTDKTYYISAPIYQQAFRWLLVLLNKNKYFSNKWTISYNEDYSSLFLGGCNMGVFKTETECLKKLIEISRNGI